MVELDLSQRGLLSATVTAFVLLAFSVVVGGLCRFRGPGRWYAVFGVGFALAAALSNLASAFLVLDPVGATLVPAADGPDAGTYWVSLSLNVASGVAAWLWTWGAMRLLDAYGGRPFRWMGWTGAGLAVGSAVPSLFGPQAFVADTLWTAVFLASALAFLVPVGWMGAAAVIMARARGREWRAGQAILASALSAYPIAWPAWGAITALPFSRSVALGALVIALGSFIALQVAWLGLRARGGGREAIAVTAVADAALVLGIGMGLFIPDESPSSVARIYDVVLVAYAILRLQYLDLDLKVRWGISKGTVAGIVVAVVFVVSEGAQSLFGEDKQWIGLAVGGLVVFAIAPIQRAADKLAVAAVPGARAGAGRSAAESVYWEAYQVAKSDGVITPREEVHLARIADRLGIGAERALQLREATADERA